MWEIVPLETGIVERLDHFPRVVSATITDHQNVEIDERLKLDRSQGTAKSAAPVVSREDDADCWTRRHAGLKRRSLLRSNLSRHSDIRWMIGTGVKGYGRRQ
jgi:hypothetical protein